MTEGIGARFHNAAYNCAAGPSSSQSGVVDVAPSGPSVPRTVTGGSCEIRTVQTASATSVARTRSSLGPGERTLLDRRPWKPRSSSSIPSTANQDVTSAGSTPRAASASIRCTVVSWA